MHAIKCFSIGKAKVVKFEYTIPTTECLTQNNSDVRREIKCISICKAKVEKFDFMVPATAVCHKIIHKRSSQKEGKFY